MSETPDMERDVALRALLRQHTPEPPHDQVDWSAMHERITGEAAPLLRQQRVLAAGSTPWMIQLARWSGRAVPFTSAIAAVLAVVLLNGGRGPSGAAAPVAAPPEPLATSQPDDGVTPADLPADAPVTVASAADVEFYTIEEELAAGEALLLAGVDADALLEVALFREAIND